MRLSQVKIFKSIVNTKVQIVDNFKPKLITLREELKKEQPIQACITSTT
jgi:hypothetical protein